MPGKAPDDVARRVNDSWIFQALEVAAMAARMGVKPRIGGLLG